MSQQSFEVSTQDPTQESAKKQRKQIKPRSSIWKYFTKEDGFAYCDIEGCTANYPIRTESPMWAHLREKHHESGFLIYHQTPLTKYKAPSFNNVLN